MFKSNAGRIAARGRRRRGEKGTVDIRIPDKGNRSGTRSIEHLKLAIRIGDCCRCSHDFGMRAVARRPSTQVRRDVQLVARKVIKLAEHLFQQAVKQTAEGAEAFFE